jgi:hypothetical protein
MSYKIKVKKYLHRISILIYICTTKQQQTQTYVHNRHYHLSEFSINRIIAGYYGYRLRALPINQKRH